jgi:hypothetical protein
VTLPDWPNLRFTSGIGTRKRKKKTSYRLIQW